LHCVLKQQIIGTEFTTEASLGTVWIAGNLFFGIGATRNVRFGSLADICAATSHVRFTPNSDRESEIPQKAMSALAPKADMCGAATDVRFGPIADVGSAAKTVSTVTRFSLTRRAKALSFPFGQKLIA
jgi:hypothetical protein